MTEAEWLDCKSIPDMLHFLRYDAPADPGRARKYRLFACGLVRRIDDLDDDSLAAVALAERIADKNLIDHKLDATELQIARNSGLQGIARKLLLQSPRFAATDVAYSLFHFEPMLFSLLRDVMGNPFRPARFEPNWRTPEVLTLARDIYQDRAFDRLPSLATALAKAGCDDETMLKHCHAATPHMRGCWLVDLALGFTD